MSVRKVLGEFGEFIGRGNVMDLAVGVIIGGAFTSIVNSLVTDVIDPVISILAGGTGEVAGMSLVLNGVEIRLGSFLGAVISFLITAAAVFAIVRAVNGAARLKAAALERAGIRTHEAAGAPAPRTCPYCRGEIAPDATRCPHCTSKLEGYSNRLED